MHTGTYVQSMYTLVYFISTKSAEQGQRYALPCWLPAYWYSYEGWPPARGDRSPRKERNIYIFRAERSVYLYVHLSSCIQQKPFHSLHDAHKGLGGARVDATRGGREGRRENHQIIIGQVRSDQIIIGQIRSDQIIIGRIRSDQIIIGQIRSYQIIIGQIRSYQIIIG